MNMDMLMSKWGEEGQGAATVTVTVTGLKGERGGRAGGRTGHVTTEADDANGAGVARGPDRTRMCQRCSKMC